MDDEDDMVESSEDSIAAFSKEVGTALSIKSKKMPLSQVANKVLKTNDCDLPTQKDQLSISLSKGSKDY